MEIERLPLGQSHADKCRAGELKWRGAPPGLSPELAEEFIAKLKTGSTVRTLTAGGKPRGYNRPYMAMGVALDVALMSTGRGLSA